MSIRKQLTLWYAFILIAAFALFGSTVYFIVWFTLTRQINDQLEATAVAIAEQSRPAMENGQLVVDVPPLDAFRATQVYVEVLDQDGNIRNTNLPAFSSLFDPAAYASISQQAVDAKQAVWTQSRHRYTDLRVLTVPLVASLRSPGADEPRRELLGYMQLAAPIQDVERATSSLLVSLLAVGTVGVVIATAAGWMMARRALSPVDEITRTAVNIYRAESLDQRVNVKTNDEVGRLGGAFNEMLERLSELFASQQRFVADVSHEMRTPLTVIRGNADLMRAIGAADKESLDAIISESDRMTRMVSNLLLLSQADSGQLPMKVEPLDLGPLVAEVERAGRMLSESRHSRVTVTAKVGDALLVEGDRDRLKQVLLNLIDNGIKHTPDGGAVAIEAVAVDDSIKLLVSDTGIGIPAADLPHVFDRFYRVDKARSRAQGGAGLGLAIVKSIVEAHGGRIEARSESGRGTTFIVSLPAFQPNLV